MKLPAKQLVLASLLSVLAVTGARAQYDAASYNDAIIGEQIALIDRSLQYTISSVHSDDPHQTELLRLEVIKQIDRSVANIEKMPPLNGDTRLRDEAIAVFKTYRDIYSVDFRQTAALSSTREESYEAMEAYFDSYAKAEARLQKANARFLQAQKDFAKNQGMDLTENELEDVMAPIVAVNAYSREVFLEYFRASKSLAVMLDALQAEDTKAMKSARDLSLKACAASEAELKAIPGYEGDTKYRDIASAYVRWQKNFTEKDYAELIDFVMRKNSLSQADVDRYNAIINGYNQENSLWVGEFNAANQALLRKHVPTE